MKVNSIKITPDNAAINWTDSEANEWTLKTMVRFPADFGAAIKGMGEVAARHHHLEADMLQVRSIVWSEKKERLYVKLAGVLAAPSEDAPKKPGKFSTPKIEVDLTCQDAVRAMENAAIAYAKSVAGETK